MNIETKDGKAILASPFEAFPHYLELPPVKKGHISGAAIFRLRALHPGDPLSTRVDVRTAAASGRFPAFHGTTPIRVVAHAAPLGPGDPADAPTMSVLPGYSLLAAGWRELRKAGNLPQSHVTGVLIADEWVQAVRFADGTAVAGSARPFDTPEEAVSAVTGAVGALPRLPEESEPAGLFAIYATGMGVPHFPAQGGHADSVSIPAKTVLSGLRIASERLFRPVRPATSRPLAIATATLAALVMFSAGFRAERAARLWEGEAAKAKRDYESKMRAEADLVSLVKERDALAEGPKKGAADTGPDAYSVFSRLAELLPGTVLSSFTLQDGILKLTARSADALTSVASLRGDPLFADVTLTHAAPSPGGGETFTVSGRVRR